MGKRFKLGLAAAAGLSLVTIASAAAGRTDSGRTAVAASSLEVSSAEVSAINDRGQIVGTLTTKGGAHHGFVWRNGSWKLLGAEADEINDHGQILGYAKYSKAAGPQHLVLWQNGKRRNVGLDNFRELNDRGQIIGEKNGRAAIWQNGTVSLLPLAGAGAINDQGQVVGWAAGCSAQSCDIAEWQDGKLTDLGPGSPAGINDDGEILGYQNGDVKVWQNGTATDLGQGVPRAINERGDVLWFRIPDQTEPWVGSTLLWRDGKTADVGESTSDQAVSPELISDTDQVVGAFRDYDNDTGYLFVWQNGTMTRLPEPKRYPVQVVAMNDHNQIIGDNCGCYRRGVGRVYNSKVAVLWTLQGNRIEMRRLFP